MTVIPKQRFLALDIFRGLTIFFMIIVNTGGPDPFPELHHAQWHGFTLTDLVFPSFLFAVGTSLSFVKNRWDKMQNKEVLWKIFKRTFILFLLGYLMYWFPFVKFDGQNNVLPFPMDETRVMGVLQRIALCYGIVALMVRFFDTRSIVITGFMLLLWYWIVMAWLGDYTVAGNIGTKLDVALLTPDHMYIKKKDFFEPEGLLGTIPSLVNVIAGYLCGLYIKKNPKSYETLAKLAIAGFIFAFIAYLWNHVFPINKKLWTSSFVLLTVGLDLLIITVILYAVDFKGYKKGSYFFEVFGKNAILIYFFSELMPIFLYTYHGGDERALYHHVFENTWGVFGKNHYTSLLWAVSFTMLCWLFGYFLDKKKIYLKV